MKIKITAFGYLAEIIDINSLEAEERFDINSLKEKLEKEFPGMKNREYKIAVNRELVNDNRIVDWESEVVLLPPFAGG